MRVLHVRTKAKARRCLAVGSCIAAVPNLVLGLAGCARAPSFSILGSFFPAWLLCLVAGILLTAVANRVLAFCKLENQIRWSIVVYPSLTIFFACTLWLIFFN
jgi:hypothetical protein